MGIWIRAYLDDEPMPHDRLQCDGRSLADYYLAAMADGMDAQSLFGSIVQAHTGQAQDQVIHHDFRQKQTPADGTPRTELIRLLQGLTGFIQEPDENDKEVGDLASFTQAVGGVRAAILAYRGPLQDIVGRDVTHHREGAVADCDDLLMAVRLCRDDGKRLRVLIC